MPILDPQSGAAANGMAADSHSLDQLRMLANKDPAKAVKQVATQFEALFMQMVLKSMREASPKSGLLDSSEQQTYTGMLDEQLAQKIAAGGTGLGEVIARQLSRNLPRSAGSGPAAAQTGPSAPNVSPVAAPVAATNMAAAAPTAVAAGAAAGATSGHLVQTIRAAQAARGAK